MEKSQAIKTVPISTNSAQDDVSLDITNKCLKLKSGKGYNNTKFNLNLESSDNKNIYPILNILIGDHYHRGRVIYPDSNTKNGSIISNTKDGINYPYFIPLYGQLLFDNVRFNGVTINTDIADKIKIFNDSFKNTELEKSNDNLSTLAVDFNTGIGGDHIIDNDRVEIMPNPDRPGIPVSPPSTPIIPDDGWDDDDLIIDDDILPLPGEPDNPDSPEENEPEVDPYVGKINPYLVMSDYLNNIYGILKNIHNYNLGYIKTKQSQTASLLFPTKRCIIIIRVLYNTFLTNDDGTLEAPSDKEKYVTNLSFSYNPENLTKQIIDINQDFSVEIFPENNRLRILRSWRIYECYIRSINFKLY